MAIAKKGVLHLGYEWDPVTGRIGRRLVTFDISESHFIVIGPTRCGKDATLGIPNTLLHLHGYSVIDLDTTGQAGAVCGQACIDAGMKFMPVNPMGLHVARYPYLKTLGCNVMLRGIDPKSPRFYEEAAAIADAFDWGENGKGDPFWSNAGRDYATFLIMHVRLRDGDDANLSTVLQLMMEAEEIDDTGRPIKGPRYVAADAIATGNFQIAALAGRFLSNAAPKTIDSIRQTAQTAARSLLSDPIRYDLSLNGIDWNVVTETPCYVPVILPAEDIEGFHKVWARLVLSCGLNVIYRKAGDVRVKVILRLPEFFALGPLRAVQAAMGQAAKYGVRVWPVLQDIGQLESMFGDKGAQTFIANAGCLFAFTPGDDNTAGALSRHAGKHAVVHESYSTDPQSGQVRVSVDVRDEWRWPADKIMSIPKFHGLVWKFGNSVPQPVACKPYFDDELCLRVAQPDPFHSGAAPATLPKHRRWPRAVLAAVLVVVAATLPLGLLHSSPDERPVIAQAPPPAPVLHYARPPFPARR